MEAKIKSVSAWTVLCSKDGIHRAWIDRERAIEHRESLDLEYGGLCGHRVVPCVISYSLPKGALKPKKK